MSNALAFLAVVLLSPVVGYWWLGKGRPDKVQPGPRRQRWHQSHIDPMVTPRGRIRPQSADPGRVSRHNDEVPAEIRGMFGPPSTPNTPMSVPEAAVKPGYPQRERPWEWLHEDGTPDAEPFKLFWANDQ